MEITEDSNTGDLKSYLYTLQILEYVNIIKERISKDQLMLNDVEIILKLAEKARLLILTSKELILDKKDADDIKKYCTSICKNILNNLVSNHKDKIIYTHPIYSNIDKKKCVNIPIKSNYQSPLHKDIGGFGQFGESVEIPPLVQFKQYKSNAPSQNLSEHLYGGWSKSVSKCQNISNKSYPSKIFKQEWPSSKIFKQVCTYNVPCPKVSSYGTTKTELVNKLPEKVMCKDKGSDYISDSDSDSEVESEYYSDYEAVKSPFMTTTSKKPLPDSNKSTNRFGRKIKKPVRYGYQ